MENNTNLSETAISDLHNKLVNVVIDFFETWGLPTDAWDINFHFDDLESSVKSGYWSNCSDSALELRDDNGNTLFFDA